MFKTRIIKALQDDTPSRNLANEFINEQGSCATLTHLGSLIWLNEMHELVDIKGGFDAGRAGRNDVTIAGDMTSH